MSVIGFLLILPIKAKIFPIESSPSAALPGLDVDITWIVMSTEEEPGTADCEVQRGARQLAAEGKKQLICLKIPSVIRNKPI